MAEMAKADGGPYRSVFDGQFMTAGGAVDRSNFRWSAFRGYGQERMFFVVSRGVFPFMKALGAESGGPLTRYMADAAFRMSSPAALTRAVEALDAVCELAGAEARGEVYGQLVSRLLTAPVGGGVAIPAHIARMVVEMADPRSGEAVCDPSCGAAEILSAALSHVLAEKGQSGLGSGTMSGYCSGPSMARIAAMNMLAHGAEDPRIVLSDGLQERDGDPGSFDLVLSGPLFGNAPGSSPGSRSGRRTASSEAQLLSLVMRITRPGGRCIAIVPESLLHEGSKPSRAIRKALVEECRLDAVVSMPRWVFSPQANAPTAVLAFSKDEGGTGGVWFYRMDEDGYAHDSRGKQVPESDIPDIVRRFRDREGESARGRSEKSFVVPREEIVAGDYSLSMAKYMRAPCSGRPRRPSAEVLDEMIVLSDSLSAELRGLRGML